MPKFNFPPDAILGAIGDDLDNILSNAKSYTASQTQPKNVYTSKARLPEVRMTEQVMPNKPNTVLNRPVSYYEGKSTTLMSDVVKARQAAHIEALLSSVSLDLTDLPKTNFVPENNLVIKSKISSMTNKLLGILQLATYPIDTNSNEQEELFKRRAYGATSPTVDVPGAQ